MLKASIRDLTVPTAVRLLKTYIEPLNKRQGFSICHSGKQTLYCDITQLLLRNLIRNLWIRSNPDINMYCIISDFFVYDSIIRPE